MRRKRGTFRGNCLAAKARLGGGFWNSARDTRDTSVKKAQMHGASGEEVLNRFISQFKSSVQRQYENNEEEEQFYRKIRSFLNTAPNSNPLAQVIDREYLSELGDTERERYVFNLSAKVQRCIERFNQEQELNICSM